MISHGTLPCYNQQLRSIRVTIITSLMLLSGCSSEPDAVVETDQPAGTGRNEIFVANHGWHTGIIVPSRGIQQRLPQLKERYGDVPYIEIGWGDKGFYQAEQITFALTLKAVFWPTESVVHTAAVPVNPVQYFQHSKVESIYLNDGELSSLIDFIESSFQKKEGSGTHTVLELKEGLYGDSQFYRGAGHYFMMNTCNKWTAKGIRSAGMDIFPTFKLTASSITKYLRENRTFRSIVLSDEGEIDKKIKEIMDKYELPGAAVSIFENHQIRYRKSFGFRSIENQKPINNSTIFEGASLSKPILAIIVLRLSEQGLIDIHKPLANYYEYQDLKGSKYYQYLTAANILNHSSGLPNWRPDEKLEFISVPMEKYTYSAEAYYYLQKTVESIYKMDYSRIVKEQIFDPTGMTSSSFKWKKDYEGNFAQGHDTGLSLVENKTNRKVHAAESLHTNLTDYSRFLLAFLQANLVSEKSLDRILNNRIGLSSNAMMGAQGLGLYWGMGFGLEANKHKSFSLWHHGDNSGYKNYFKVDLVEGKGVLIFTNSDSGLKFSGDLVEYLFPFERHESIIWFKRWYFLPQVIVGLVTGLLAIFIYILWNLINARRSSGKKYE